LKTCHNSQNDGPGPADYNPKILTQKSARTKVKTYIIPAGTGDNELSKILKSQGKILMLKILIFE